MFECSSDNDKIKHIYGNYCFWSWLRYWFLDSANLVTLMLVDKSYFDYDYEKVEKTVEIRSVIHSDEESAAILARFGFGCARKQKDLSEMDLDELQEYAVRQEEEKLKTN